MNIARLTWSQDVLWSILNGYADASPKVKVVACRNKKLSSEAIHNMVQRSNEFPPEVLIAVTRNPNISREDLVALGRHYDNDVSKAALSVQGLSNVGVATEFFYDPRVDVSNAALESSYLASYGELADELYKLLVVTENEAIREIALRSISDAVLLHQLVGEPRFRPYLEVIARNENLAIATIDIIISKLAEKGLPQDERVLVQVAKNSNLNEDQFQRLLDYSVERGHVGIYLALLENNSIPGHILESALVVSPHVFIDPLGERFQVLSEDAKVQLEADIQESKVHALSRNNGISPEELSEKYNISVTLQPHEVLDVININFEETTPGELYDRITLGIVDDQFSDDLMRVADNEDMDPDIQMSVMLALMGKEGNRLSTLNAMQNLFEGRSNSLLGYVGEEGVHYKKNARSYISTRKFTATQKARMAIRSMARSISSITSRAMDKAAQQVARVKDKLPTNEMTEKDLTREETRRERSQGKYIKVPPYRRNKRGRRR